MIPIEVVLVFGPLLYFLGRHQGVKAFKKRHRDMWE